jgi:hypothetical protein
MSYIGEKPWSTIGLDVYPSIVLDGKSELYEDDGDSIGYRDGKYRKTPLSTSSDGNDILINIGAAVGSFDGKLTAVHDTFDGSLNSRTWKVRVHAPASWGALLGAKLDGADVTAVKIAKSAAGYPFAILGASRDSDVYEITISNSSILTTHQVRLTFESPVAEDVPITGGIRVDFDSTDTVAQQSVNLTVAGELDWVHFGTDGAASTTKKAGITDRIIGELKVSGTTGVGAGYTEFKWTDGNGNAASREFIRNGLTLSDGSFEFDINVGTDAEKVTLYIGGDDSTGRLTITDSNSARFVDVAGIGGLYARRVVVSAVADEPAKLTVRYVKTGGSGNIALYAVAVSGPGSVSDIPVERFVGLDAVTGRIDLSTGSADWYHFGYNGATNANAVNRKAGGMLLSPPVVSGSRVQVTDYNSTGNVDNGGSAGVFYTGGTTPAESGANNQHAFQVSGTGNYVQISAPSTTHWRRLKIYTGVWNANSRVEVVDESGVDLAVYTFSGGGTAVLRCVNIVYRSAEDSSIIVKIIKESGTGNISLCGYALYEIGVGDVRANIEPISNLNINLNGAADWVHLGYGNVGTATNRKAGVLNQILTMQTNSGGAIGGVNDYNRASGTTATGMGGITYAGGVDPVSVTGNENAIQTGTTNGWFEFEALSAPDSGWRRLDVYTGAWNACNRVEVMDASRNVLARFEFSAAGAARTRKLGILYRDSGGKIIVRITKVSNYSGASGNVSLAAYAVYDVKSVETNAAVTVESAPSGTVQLAAAANVDWAHYGYSAATRYNHSSAASVRMIGDPVGLREQGLERSTDFIPNFSWTGGNPNATVSNTRDFVYSSDGMKFNMNIQPGIWKIKVYTSVWWAKGYLSFVDETGHVIGTAMYESKNAMAGTSEYRCINVVYSSGEAHTITVTNMPALGINNHVGNMSYAAVTVEAYIDHVSIDGGDAPDIRTGLTAKAYVSPDDSLEFFSYAGVDFKWQKSVSRDGPFEDIAGATSAQYKPLVGDVGSYLRLVVTFAVQTVYSVTQQPVSSLIFDPVFWDGKGNILTSMD